MSYHRVGYTGAFDALALPHLPIDFKADSGYRLVPLTETQTEAARNALDGIVPGPWWQARIIAIKPGGIIHLHSDPLPDGRQKAVRYHVVLKTNPYCWNYHNGDIQRLELGGVYTMDESVEHASVNWGTTARVHLVIDVIVNAPRTAYEARQRA